MRKLLFANWKMNLPSESFTDFVTAMKGLGEGVEIAVAPPFPFIESLAQASGGTVVVGGQNCSDKASGAFTGEVAASMLRRAGAHYVILGHSERRTIYKEGDDLIGRKIRQALDDGLAPCWCVGEDEATRERGWTEALLREQLRTAAGAAGALPAELVIAYEPVWAIGTGKTATPEMAAEAHRFIRQEMREIAPGSSTRILYGGSVTADNAASLAAQPEIDGFLVGGASLASAKFRAIGDALRGAAR